ncbi:MAG TPA: hypothetical protein VFV72_02080 [Candidatus Limnocylindrales bacterium]|nr:hypothetical protein [Candidatus Limnocylindrales bacterium]
MIARARLIVVAASAAILAVACASPSPTAAPVTPSPVQASPNPALVDFETHLRDSLKSQGSLVRELAAATTGTNEQLGLVARQLADWADTEQSWLDEHPADACYENAWLTYQSGVEDVATAAAAFVTLAAKPSPASDAEGQEAGLTLGTGTSSLNAAADLANQARAWCR